MSLIQLDQVPYVKNVPNDGRHVVLSAYYDHTQKQWISYVPQDGKVLGLKVSNLVEGL